MRFISAAVIFSFVFFSPAVVLGEYSEYLDREELYLQSNTTADELPGIILYKQYLDNANYYLKERLYMEAKELLWKAINLFPQRPDAYVNLGIVNLQQNDFETAQRMLQEAEKLSPPDYYQSEILFYNLGVCYFLQPDYDEAALYFQKALQIHPDFSEAAYYLGLTNIKQGRSEDAFINLFKASYLFMQEGRGEYQDKARQRLDAMRLTRSVDMAFLSKV